VSGGATPRRATATTSNHSRLAKLGRQHQNLHCRLPRAGATRRTSGRTRTHPTDPYTASGRNKHEERRISARSRSRPHKAENRETEAYGKATEPGLSCYGVTHPLTGFAVASIRSDSPPPTPTRSPSDIEQVLLLVPAASIASQHHPRWPANCEPQQRSGVQIPAVSQRPHSSPGCLGVGMTPWTPFLLPVTTMTAPGGGIAAWSAIWLTT